MRLRATFGCNIMQEVISQLPPEEQAKLDPLRVGKLPKFGRLWTKTIERQIEEITEQAPAIVEATRFVTLRS
jgi:hypothetical protein